MDFGTAERESCEALVDLALREDLGRRGDLTSQLLIPPAMRCESALRSRSVGVIAGLAAAEMVMKAVDPDIRFERRLQDGTKVSAGDCVAAVSGRMRSVMAGERTALNFLQRLSGVATRTRAFVQAAGKLGCVLDTRKTTPGWRILEKYAVRCGGGTNHRMGLYDGVLIKDNHLAALASAGQSLAAAVQAARTGAGPEMTVTVEVDSLDQLDQALACGPDIVLLDNMSLELLKEAVRRRNDRAPRVLLEASGGITLDSVAAIAASGVNRISVGALTHSAAALDIGLDYEPP